ncbi:MAG: glycosidase, partial [Candidatus Krumholzibacteria bacterium]|nr:glycosidase [Candidatus Krumholzibacteria bacterium]
PDFSGQYDVYPRAAYYALRKAFALDPYAPDTDLAKIREHYGSIHPATAALEARGNTAMQKSSAPGLVSVRNVRMEFETFSTGGSNISTPEQDEPGTKVPAFLGFDNLQSFYTDFEVRPSGNVVGTVSINILGNVPVNPIDEIFYEDRGRRQTIEVDGEPLRLDDIERVKVYNATVSWEDRWFSLNGFYRAGHLHWGHEGDFFGIYRDAYYGDNIDIYNGIAPVGVEIAAKKKLKGLKLAFGPELYWGANPAFLVKYQRRIGSVNWTALYQNEFQQRLESVSSLAVPRPATKRAALSLATTVGPFGVTAGGIWAGEALVDETFQVMAVTNGDTLVLLDKVKEEDTFGGKVKLTWESGRWHWYGQYAYAGIVANGGPDALITFTGWSLKNPGAGNGNLVSTGLAVNVGKFQ